MVVLITEATFVAMHLFVNISCVYVYPINKNTKQLNDTQRIEVLAYVNVDTRAEITHMCLNK